jgi:hypothetical protein
MLPSSILQWKIQQAFLLRGKDNSIPTGDKKEIQHDRWPDMPYVTSPSLTYWEPTRCNILQHELYFAATKVKHGIGWLPSSRQLKMYVPKLSACTWTPCFRAT